MTNPPNMKTISPKLLSVPDDISFMILQAPNTVRKIPSDAKNGNACCGARNTFVGSIRGHIGSLYSFTCSATYSAAMLARTASVTSNSVYDSVKVFTVSGNCGSTMNRNGMSD